MKAHDLGDNKREDYVAEIHSWREIIQSGKEKNLQISFGRYIKILI